MKSSSKILIAFILNFGFSIFEFIGGALSGSIAIASDAIHDLSDALSIGLAYFLEKKSHKKADSVYTFGYARYSVLGSVVVTLILLVGSVFVIANAVKRFFEPATINYSSMIIFAIIGVIVNFAAAFLTHEKDNLNEKAVSLHMLEDVLGWVAVLIGAVVMKFTNISLIDPILSIAIAVFIFINAIKNLKEALDLVLEKAPDGIKIEEIKSEVMEIEEVKDIHHIHLWSLNVNNNFATMHIVSDCASSKLKEKVREKLAHLGINHSTLEFEASDEECKNICCEPEEAQHHHHHHHHHHH